MDETLRQLGELLLGSIPTIILLLVVFSAYTAIVHKPLAAEIVRAVLRPAAESSLGGAR